MKMVPQNYNFNEDYSGRERFAAMLTSYILDPNMDIRADIGTYNISMSAYSDVEVVLDLSLTFSKRVR